MAFEPLMSGVCKMLGTRAMISVPTKAVRMKTVRVLQQVFIRRSPSCGRDRHVGHAERLRAGGVVNWPFGAIVTPRTISSLQSGANCPLAPKSARSFRTLFAYMKLACVPISAGGFASPTTRTPWCSITSPALVSSTFPPPSAAMSMMTDPSPIASTIAVVTRIGALRPGTAAVVMMTSEFATSATSAWSCAPLLVAQLARVAPAPSAVTPSWTKVAPADSASSFAALRTS